jgi:hypothetical protein
MNKFIAKLVILFSCSVYAETSVEKVDLSKENPKILFCARVS